jgi:mono/diheme cytochrome c family protein
MKNLIPLALLALASAACSLGLPPPEGPAAPAECDEPGAPTYANFGGPFLQTNCTSCHSSALPAGARQGAPLSSNLDNADDIIDQMDRILVRTVEQETMPPAARTSDAERERLALWLECGAPGVEDAVPPPTSPPAEGEGEGEGEGEPDIQPNPEPTEHDPSDLVVASIDPAKGVRLEWTDNSDIDAAFIVDRCEGAGCENFAPVLYFEVPEHDHAVDAFVEPSKTYRYRVYVIFPDPATQFGISGASNIVDVTTPAEPFTVFQVDPGPAEGEQATELTANIEGSAVALSWADNSERDVGYLVQLCAGEGCEEFQTIDGVGDGLLAYTHVGVGPGQYRYRVIAVTFTPDGIIGLGASEPVSVTVE